MIYKVNHILIDSEISAKEALQELKEGLNFEEVSIKHSTDTETLESKGYLGEFMLTDLPDYHLKLLILKLMKFQKLLNLLRGIILFPYWKN